ncbi:MAG: hypothetical protein M3442_08570, partial [Chloroflexota bacterium]|nr:hypothetical protein [Chloroflexota bacterium]
MGRLAIPAPAKKGVVVWHGSWVPADGDREVTTGARFVLWGEVPAAGRVGGGSRPPRGERRVIGGRGGTARRAQWHPGAAGIDVLGAAFPGDRSRSPALRWV